jgi:hypothetical protein
MTGNDPNREALLDLLEREDRRGADEEIRKFPLEDVKWFIDKIDEEIYEIELRMEGYVPNPGAAESLRQHKIWSERVRMIAREALHDKQVTARKRAGARNLGKDIGLLVIGAVIAVAIGALFQYFF